ncbi:hypothetical protein ACH3XW_22190 [Acanthocheilonema viteae]
MNTEDAKGMKNISVADGSFTPYTFDEIEGMREIAEYVNEMVICAKSIMLIENRNSILERLKNAFKTVRLLEGSIKMNDDVQNDADIRNNMQMIAASNPWPSLTDQLHRYLRNLPHRLITLRLILRYLLVFYFILLHGAFFQCNIF